MTASRAGLVAGLAVLGLVVAFAVVAVGPEGPGDGADAGTGSNVTIPDECPTEERYVNVYESRQPPEWFPESSLNMSDLEHQTYEVSRYPNCPVTEAHLDGAWRLYNRSYEAAEEMGLFDVETAFEKGYGKANLHYMNVDYLLDNDTLNPHRPEFLVYYKAPRGQRKILVGYMYENLEKEGDQVGGPLTYWHYHPFECCNHGAYLEILRNETEYRNFDELYEGYYGGVGAIGKYRSPAMMHVWFVKHPEGPFSSNMAVPKGHVESPEKMNESTFKRWAMQSFRRVRSPTSSGQGDRDGSRDGPSPPTHGHA